MRNPLSAYTGLPIASNAQNPLKLRCNLSNGRGDIVAQSDAIGALTWTASYEAFGKRTKETGTNADKQRANSKDEDPTGLLNEGFRYRDIETGVWLSRDPAGFVDGPNLYAYVKQNPWTCWDPVGLATIAGHKKAMQSIDSQLESKRKNGGITVTEVFAASLAKNSHQKAIDKIESTARTMNWLIELGGADKNLRVNAENLDDVSSEFQEMRNCVWGYEKLKTDALSAATGATLKGLSLTARALAARGAIPAAPIATRNAAWALGPAPRGQLIEEAWGHNLPQAFKTFDRFDNGVATSIKSFDLDLPSFGKANGVWNSGRKAVDAVIDFDGYTLKGVTITPQMIQQRAVRIAVPRTPTPQQATELNRLKQYGADNNVSVSWGVF